MINNSNNKIVVATHNGTFHLDELLAIATIKLLHPEKNIRVVRTRDSEVIDNADWVVDVGGHYDHESRRYDHHQLGSPVRDNGVPFAAFGLVWRHWGSEVCGGNIEVADAIESDFVQMVDGPDNGFETAQSLIEGGRVPSLAMLPSLWRSDLPADASGEMIDEKFNELLKIITEILQRLIDINIARYQSNIQFENQYLAAADKSIIFVPKGVWPADPSKYPETYFIAYQDVENNTWKAKCVSDESFKCRRSFPVEWRGLRDAELQQISGIADAEFVHSAGFLAVAKTQSGLIEMISHAK